ncbi:MAG TPA: TIM barrel protein [Chloroflexi bacterium]|nr:TIM barrel protein [Chloroflexota bacterium]
MAKSKSSNKQDAPTLRLPLAVQLYTLRSLTLNADELLAAVAEAGYTGVELAGNLGQSADSLRTLLDKHGLQAVSAHVQLQAMEADLPGVVRFHKTIGNDTLIVPWLPETDRPTTAAGWTALGQRLDRLGRRVRMANMRLLYHNHDFEMALFEGKPAIQWLLDAARPENVGFEPDLAWIAHGGQDPVAMLQHYSGRVPRVHAKDVSDNPAERNMADVGSGRLDWDAILPAVEAAQAEWLIVEHDLPVEPLTSIRRSQAFLAEKLKL